VEELTPTAPGTRAVRRPSPCGKSRLVVAVGARPDRAQRNACAAAKPRACAGRRCCWVCSNSSGYCSRRFWRQALVLENLLLRHQLAVLTRPTRSRPRARLRTWDKLLWVLARRLRAGWREHLTFVTPDTVVR
jgi:hypothetical protein